MDAAKDAVAGADEKKEKGEKEEEGEKKEKEESQPLGGKIVDAIHLISLYVMPIAAVFVLFLKNRFRLAYRVMVGTFLFSFLFRWSPSRMNSKAEAIVAALSSISSRWNASCRPPRLRDF